LDIDDESGEHGIVDEGNKQEVEDKNWKDF